MKLSDLKSGEKATIVKVYGNGGFRKRIIEMGFVRGTEVTSLLDAPLHDPVKYRLMGYEVSLRKSEASMIEVLSEDEFRQTVEENPFFGTLTEQEKKKQVAEQKEKHIKVALVGNPNCGKTSLFNYISNSREHVGNYSGVTVEAKEGKFEFQGYTFTLIDLPGTYSLTSYSPEERYVRKTIVNDTPDVIINVIDTSNIERNLYLTTQLIDMNMPTVVALNMYDELEANGDTLDYKLLSKLLGMPAVPTIGKTGKGLDTLFHVVINLFEGYNFLNEHGEINKELFIKEFENNPKKHQDIEGESHENIYEIVHHIHINHGNEIEQSINRLRSLMQQDTSVRAKYSARFLSIKLLEGDTDAETFVKSLKDSDEIFAAQKEEQKRLEKELKEDSESAISNAKYGFIAGALKETLRHGKVNERKFTEQLDSIVTHKILGYPVFLFFIFLMFECTFTLGNYPMEWISNGTELLSDTLRKSMADGMLKDLLIDGIIGGIGGVIVFLPNILILYLFISFMEDSGYMARAAFIMDKVMHKMGLHGKSFIPLIMGFGCNVPAIMGTRIIESRKSRIITMMVLPFMSCSARLPIYLMLIGSFFPTKGSLMLFLLYFIGVVLAIIFAKIFRNHLKEDEAPFVLELPPYRMPTCKSVLIHVWDKTKEYLKKMGGIILVASIVVWFLGYFPQDKELDKLRQEQIENAELAENQDFQAKWQTAEERQKENSYIGKIGHMVEPMISPLGFNWQMGVSLFSGAIAKEVVVSTLTVLYSGGNEDGLGEKMKKEVRPDGTLVYTPLVTFCFMLFVLIYFPCIATLSAIKNESGSWKWPIVSAVYTSLLAWILTFVVYNVGLLLGF